MKLGILLFGHLRTFEYSGRYFVKNIAKKYDCDIFIHTWDETDAQTKCWEDRKKKNVSSVDDRIVKKIRTLYSPKALKIGHQHIEDEVLVQSSDGKKKLSLNGMNFMFESMRAANQLRIEYERSSGTKYDYILVTRPDVAIYNYLPIEETIREAKELNLNISNTRFFAGLYGNSKTNVRLMINRTPDILFFGIPSVIDRYIQANEHFSFESVNRSFKNVVSVYTRNEIKAGLIPVEICFACNKDWKNYSFDELQKFLKKKSIVQRFIQLFKA